MLLWHWYLKSYESPDQLLWTSPIISFNLKNCFSALFILFSWSSWMFSANRCFNVGMKRGRREASDKENCEMKEKKKQCTKDAGFDFSLRTISPSDTKWHDITVNNGWQDVSNFGGKKKKIGKMDGESGRGNQNKTERWKKGVRVGESKKRLKVTEN